jgi:hypothetical protein
VVRKLVLEIRFLRLVAALRAVQLTVKDPALKDALTEVMRELYAFDSPDRWAGSVNEYFDTTSQRYLKLFEAAPGDAMRLMGNEAMNHAQVPASNRAELEPLIPALFTETHEGVEKALKQVQLTLR